MDMFNATEIYEGIEYSWRKYFTGGVFNETFEAASEGGPTCYNTVRPEFRYNICLLMVSLQHSTSLILDQIPLEVYILQKLYPKLKALFKSANIKPFKHFSLFFLERARSLHQFILTSLNISLAQSQLRSISRYSFASCRPARQSSCLTLAI